MQHVVLRSVLVSRPGQRHSHHSVATYYKHYPSHIPRSNNKDLLDDKQSLRARRGRDVDPELGGLPLFVLPLEEYVRGDRAALSARDIVAVDAFARLDNASLVGPELGVRPTLHIGDEVREFPYRYRS